MSDFQICLCGAMPDYPHAHDCPRPLYRCTEAGEARWDAERAALRRRLEAARLLPRHRPNLQPPEDQP